MFRPFHFLFPLRREAREANQRLQRLVELETKHLEGLVLAHEGLGLALGLLNRIAKSLRPRRPQNPLVTLLGETTMPDRLTYSVKLDPLPADSDVVKRRCTVTIDGAAQTPVEAAPGAEFPNLDVPQGSLVGLAFVDIDDAGNESAPNTMEFTAEDKIAPAAPAGVHVAQIGETEVAAE